MPDPQSTTYHQNSSLTSTQKTPFGSTSKSKANRYPPADVDTLKIPFSSKNSIITDPILNLPAVIHDPILHKYERLVDLATYVQDDLDVDRIHRVHRFLWLCGARGRYRPLHRQKGFYSREIVIIQQGDLHLTWDADALRLFLKPLPGYLLNHDFWQAHICPDEKTFRNALGFLRSYVHLVPSETDFEYAIQERLLPKIHTLAKKSSVDGEPHRSNGSNGSYTSISEKVESLDKDEDITWPQWRAFVEDFLTTYPQQLPAELRKTRWEYSELRLSRLNLVYRFVLGYVFRGYQFGYASYGSFLSRNSSWLIAAFAYVAIVHGAMQVGLGTPQLEEDEAFARACYGFAVFTIIAPVGILSILIIWMACMFVSNYAWTRSEQRRLRMARRREDEERQTAANIPPQPMHPTN